MIPPGKPEVGWRRLVAAAVVLVVMLAAALFAFRHEIATMVSNEARASTPVQVAAAPTTPKPPPTVAPPAPAKPAAPSSSAATVPQRTAGPPQQAAPPQATPQPAAPQQVMRQPAPTQQASESPGQVAPQSVVRANANATAAAATRPNRPPPAEIARPRIEVDLASSKIDLVDGRYVVRGQL